MIRDCDVRRYRWRSRADGIDSHTDFCSGFAAVEVRELAVAVDGFACIDGKPSVAVVEAALECKIEVCATGYVHGKGELR